MISVDADDYETVIDFTRDLLAALRSAVQEGSLLHNGQCGACFGGDCTCPAGEVIEVLGRAPELAPKKSVN